MGRSKEGKKEREEGLEVKLKRWNFSLPGRIGLLLAGTWLIAMLVFQPWTYSRSGFFEGPTKFVWDLGARVEEPIREFAWRQAESRYAEQGKGSLALSQKQAADYMKQWTWWNDYALKNSLSKNPGVSGEAEWDWSQAEGYLTKSFELEKRGQDQYDALQRHLHDAFNPLHGYVVVSVAIIFLFLIPYAVAWAVRPAFTPPTAP